jgi:hypothetical protein
MQVARWLFETARKRAVLALLLAAVLLAFVAAAVLAVFR